MLYGLEHMRYRPRMSAGVVSRLRPRFSMRTGYISIIFLLLAQHTNIVSSLYVDPPSITEREGDDEVHFFCLETQGGSQATGISWRDPHGNEYTPGTPTGNDRINVEGYRLTVYDLVREDSGSYECFRNSEDSATGDLFVYAPPTILNPMPIQEIYFEMTSLLLCQMDRGNPQATVYWLHITYNETTGAQILDEITSDWNPRFTVVENGLEISNVRRMDAGRYRCYVQNDRGVDVLDIQAAFRESPQFVNDEVELEVYLTVGESASLDCIAAGAPSPNVTWTVPPNSQLSHGPPLTSSVLDVQLSDGADTGQYNCTIQNEVGSASRLFTVKLATPPEPAVKNRNVVISLGKEQRINCSVAASPKPDFKWFLNSSPLPESSWTSSYDDVMGISTLVFKFEKNHLNSNCEISVACVATNSYGTSEHHFTLVPAAKLVCSKATKTISPTPNSNPPVVSNDPQLDRSKGSDSSDGKMSDTTFKIIIGSITVAATVIVIGIVILLVYFMKHFCRGKKFSEKQKVATNPCISQHSHLNSIPNGCLADASGALSTTSSLHHNQSYPSGITEFTMIRGRHESVDSGVSLSIPVSNPPYPSRLVNNHKEVTPPLSAIPPPSPGVGEGGEGIYHRLDHKIPSVSSFGSSLSSHSKVRLLSSSSMTDTSSVFLSSQVSTNTTTTTTSDLEESSESFSSSRDLQHKRQFHLRQYPYPQQDIECATVRDRRDSDTDSVGMIFNPSYESHKLKICSSNNSNEPPHVYETVR